MNPSPTFTEPRTILIIEDDPRLVDLLRRGLREQGCTVVAAADGEEGIALATENPFDAIILDIGLPNLSGYDVARQLRAQPNHAAILMLTAYDMEDDIIRGLDLGADDYMTKPFSFAELLVRLKVLTRSPRNPNPDVHTAGTILVDTLRHQVFDGQRPIRLTRTEFLLLSTLIQSKDRPVARQALMEALWGSDPAVTTGALDTLVNALRSKLDHPQSIRTLRGVGYTLTASPTQS